MKILTNCGSISFSFVILLLFEKQGLSPLPGFISRFLFLGTENSKTEKISGNKWLLLFITFPSFSI